MNISKVGTFRLVEDSVLESILLTSQWFKILKVPPVGLAALGFTVKFFRVSADLSVNELSKQTGIHRNQIRSIEKAKLKKGPHPETLNLLAEKLGKEFRNAIVMQGFLKEL